MASRKMLSSILKNTIQTSLKGQQHPVRRILVKNSPCIANVVYRKLSTTIIRKDVAHEHGKVEQRTQEEITKYVGDELQKVNDVLNSVPFGELERKCTVSKCFVMLNGQTVQRNVDMVITDIIMA